ncbi:Hypothetical protein CINCED_3A002981 [Cinara cedri]|nr:Hypothetical protein CINCED_3A002981 [Cinara cedri]
MNNSLLQEIKFDNQIPAIQTLVLDLNDRDIENAVNRLEGIKEINTIYELKLSFEKAVDATNYSNSTLFKKITSNWIKIKNKNDPLRVKWIKIENAITSRDWHSIETTVSTLTQSEFKPWINKLNNSILAYKNISIILDHLLHIDLCDIENIEKLSKSLHEDNDKLLLVQVFNAGKTGNYSFFSNGITSIANMNCNLALLLSHKLIMYLKKDKIGFQKFIEHCSSYINNKVLSLPFQIENFILKSDWHNAIMKLKEATRLNIFLPFNHKKMLATFYCALAREYEKGGYFKEAIKSVLRAQSCHITFRPINYLKAELYIKLAKVRKASEVLEAEYKINPSPQIARLYMSLNGKNTDQLCNLHPDYYFSHCMLAISAMNSDKYDLAYQCLNTAMAKANYLSIYLIMIQLQVSLQKQDKVIYWLNQVSSKALSDPSWRCESCDKELERWDCRCSHCDNFNCVVF